MLVVEEMLQPPVSFGTDNRLIRSDGVGKGVQASGITISDTNDISGVGTATSTDLSTTTFTILDDINQTFGLEIHEGSDVTTVNNKLTLYNGGFDAKFRFTAPTDVTFPPSGVLLSDTAIATAGTYGDATHVAQFVLRPDGRISGTPALVAITGTGGGVPGGANTQLQFNDSGVFGGDAGLTYNKTTDVLLFGTSADTGWARSGSAGVLEVNNGTIGQYRDLRARNISLMSSGRITGGGAVPPLGATDQVLAKVDGTDYNLKWVTPATGGAGTPGGSTTQVQFNDAGAFAGSANLTYVKGTGVLSAVTFVGNGAIPGTPVGVTGQALVKTTVNPYDVTWGGGTVPAGGLSGQVLTKDLAGTDYSTKWTTPATGGSTSPGGSSTYVQFNDSGAFAGNVGMTFDKATGTLNATIHTGNGTIPSGGANGAVLAKTSGSPYVVGWVPTPTPAPATKVIWILTPGSGTFTTDTGCRAMLVEAMGGGGGSAGALGSATPTAAASGGGSGGSLSLKYYSSPAASYAYVVGAGGTAGAATPTAGGRGVDTTFGTTTPLTGSGGNGSALPTAASSTFASGGGGQPQGDISTCNCDAVQVGSPGSMGMRYNQSGTLSVLGGYGGLSSWGGSAASAVSNNFVGILGLSIGGGAAGASSNNATGQAGAAGANGAIKITEFF